MFFFRFDRGKRSEGWGCIVCNGLTPVRPGNGLPGPYLRPHVLIGGCVLQHSAKTVRPHSGTKTVRSHSGAARSLGVLLLRTQTLHSRACLSVYCKRQKPLRLTARPLSGGLLQRDSNDLSVRAQKTCQIVHIVALLYFFREESGDDCGTPHGCKECGR